MKITYDNTNQIFIADSTYEEVALLSEKRGGAGWRFHGERCSGRAPCCKAGLRRNTWWTDDLIKARRLLSYADETAKAVLSETTAALEASKATDSELDLPCPTGLAYLPYQRAGIAYGLSHKNVLIADQMGLGKTIQALGIINADPTIKTILVVCPASLRINWLRESTKWLCTPRQSTIIETGKDTVPESAELVIVNYDLIHRAGIQAQLMARRWDLLVVDEAHYCKNARGALRAKAVLGEKEAEGLVHRAGRCVFLTGTPIPNGKPMEVWPLLNCLAPDSFSNWLYFAKRYGGGEKEYIPGARKVVWTWNPERTKHNLPELQQRMRATCMVRRTKDAVLTELPPKRHQIIPLPQNGTARLVAREQQLLGPLGEEIRALADSANPDDYQTALQLLQTLIGTLDFNVISALRAELAEAKVQNVVEHLDRLLEETDLDTGLPTTPKVIVFAHHHVMIDALLEKYGASAVVIDGRRSMDERQAAVDSFQTDPAVRVFIGQISAAGVGLTLTAAATVVFAELSWVPGDNEQAEDRAHRIGQTSSVLVQQLVVDGSLDVSIAKLLTAKSKRSELALDTPEKQFVLPEAEVAEAKAQRERAEAELEKLSESQRLAIRQAVQILARRCDGAVQEDGQGFNKMDSSFGHKLARESVWSARQYLAAKRMVVKYVRQLGEDLVGLIKGVP